MANTYNWDFSDYSYDVLRLMTDTALKINYKRLREVARKRLYRLAKDTTTNKSEFYKRWSNGFAATTALKSKTDFVYGLSDLMRFLSSKSSTVSGQKQIRKEKIDTLQKRGYDVDASNFDDFIRMVEDEKADKTRYDEIQFQEDWNDPEIRALKLAELED